MGNDEHSVTQVTVAVLLGVPEVSLTVLLLGCAISSFGCSKSTSQAGQRGQRGITVPAGARAALSVACRWHHDHSTAFSSALSLVFSSPCPGHAAGNAQPPQRGQRCVGDTVTPLAGAVGDTDRDIKSCQVAALGGNTSEKCSLVLSGLFVGFFSKRVGKESCRGSSLGKADFGISF